MIAVDVVETVTAAGRGTRDTHGDALAGQVVAAALAIPTWYRLNPQPSDPLTVNLHPTWHALEDRLQWGRSPVLRETNRAIIDTAWVKVKKPSVCRCVGHTAG
jgi:hypothetical protein